MNLLVSTKNLVFFEALSSETRLKIIRMLFDKPMNIKELATVLEISSAIVTRHIALLEAAGIIKCISIPGKRGMQKICNLDLKSVVLSFEYE